MMAEQRSMWIEVKIIFSEDAITIYRRSNAYMNSILESKPADIVVKPSFSYWHIVSLHTFEPADLTAGSSAKIFLWQEQEITRICGKRFVKPF
jgi:hypothetical protein